MRIVLACLLIASLLPARAEAQESDLQLRVRMAIWCANAIAHGHRPAVADPRALQAELLRRATVALEADGWGAQEIAVFTMFQPGESVPQDLAQGIIRYSDAQCLELYEGRTDPMQELPQDGEKLVWCMHFVTETASRSREAGDAATADGLQKFASRFSSKAFDLLVAAGYSDLELARLNQHYEGEARRQIRERTEPPRYSQADCAGVAAEFGLRGN